MRGFVEGWNLAGWIVRGWWIEFAMGFFGLGDLGVILMFNRMFDMDRIGSGYFRLCRLALGFSGYIHGKRNQQTVSIVKQKKSL